MEEETRYTKQDLETMRAWTLQRKIQVTQTRLIEWLGRYDWNVYVSFSGGKDSTVLADLAARVYQVFSCPKRQDPLRLVFVNTGLEYPEIQKFVRDFAEWLKAKYKIPVELEILHPSMTFPQVLSKYTALKNSCGPTTSHARRTPSGSGGPRDCRRPARRKCGTIRTAGF